MSGVSIAQGVIAIDPTDSGTFNNATFTGKVNGGNRVISVSGVGVPVSGTGSTVTTPLATVVIPAGILGPNSQLRITRDISCTNNANAKSTTITLNGTSIGGYSIASTASVSIQSRTTNRGVLNSQINTPPTLSASFGTSTSAFVTTAIDTSVAITVAITATVTNVGDTVTLESYTIEILNP